MLIHQIRSFGSLSKGYGVHVLLRDGKPEVPFRAPTCKAGGSNLSSTRQGGFIRFSVSWALMAGDKKLRKCDAFSPFKGRINKTTHRVISEGPPR